jgi:hypothetical protein
LGGRGSGKSHGWRLVWAVRRGVTRRLGVAPCDWVLRLDLATAAAAVAARWFNRRGMRLWSLSCYRSEASGLDAVVVVAVVAVCRGCRLVLGLGLGLTAPHLGFVSVSAF